MEGGAARAGKAGYRNVGPFEFGLGRASSRPTVGGLAIGTAAGASGPSWTLDAFNGDPASFTFTANANGSATSYTVPWSNAFRIVTADPGRVAVGF